MLHVEFISTYNGQADYGVYVRRLGRSIRVRRDCATDTLACTSSETTPQESADCVAATRAFLDEEHEKFLAWQASR